MENKSRLWKRKPSEKNIKKQRVLELERSLKHLNEQLSSVRTESNAKDDLLAKQAKVADEAIAGREKAEAEAISVRQELDDALLQKRIAEEGLIDTDVALKDCMQQLRSIKEDQQLIISNAALKISREQENIRILEQGLVDTSKRLTELLIQNSNLNGVLDVKEQLVKELSESKSKSEAKFMEVMAKLDSTEKLNASLKYEVCMLQKELEIQNEERKFNRKSVDAAHRQHLESIKKIAKLETECQRLRVMVRKRLPGPAALNKMRSEVERLGNNAIEMKKKKLNSTNEAFNTKNCRFGDSYDASSKSAASLIERLHALEDENNILKELLAKKNSELQASRIMSAQTSPNLSQVEMQPQEVSKQQACFELARSGPVSYDLPILLASEHSSNQDNISSAESWASALISELEHFKNRKPIAPSSQIAGISGLSLMDDFVEMEKLAVVSVDKYFGSSLSTLGDDNSCVTALSEPTGKELVPIKDLSHCSEANNGSQVTLISFEKYPSWLQDILRVIVQNHHIAQKSLKAILEDVRVALADWDYSTEAKHLDIPYCSDEVLQQPKHTSSDSFDGTISTAMLNRKSSNIRHCGSNFEKPICKLVELVERIIQRNIESKNVQHILSGDNKGTSVNNKSAPENRYVAHAFLWESSELTAVLQNLVAVCNDLLYGKADLQQLTSEVTSTLDWMVNQCSSLQYVSEMKETIKKHLDADESYSDNELKAVIFPIKEIDKLDTNEEPIITEKRKIPLFSALNGLYIFSRMDDVGSKLKDEKEHLKHEIMSMQSRERDLEEMLKTSSCMNETLLAQLSESEENISNLQIELATLKESKEQNGENIIDQKLIIEDLGTQLMVANAELNEARQKFSSLEVELGHQRNCCEELEATCLELQLQLEIASSKEAPKYIMCQDEKQIQAESDIVAVSENFAACPESILNLGKQLKVLASPGDASLFEKLISSPAAAKSNRQLQLIDHLKTADPAIPEEPKSPYTKEIICTGGLNLPASAFENPASGLLYGHTNNMNHGDNNLGNVITKLPPNSNKHKGGTDVGMLMVTPKRQRGVSSLRKLLLRRKRDSSKRIAVPMGS